MYEGNTINYTTWASEPNEKQNSLFHYFNAWYQMTVADLQLAQSVRSHLSTSILD